jgi:hypothetical protein
VIARQRAQGVPPREERHLADAVALDIRREGRAGRGKGGLVAPPQRLVPREPRKSAVRLFESGIEHPVVQPRRVLGAERLEHFPIHGTRIRKPRRVSGKCRHGGVRRAAFVGRSDRQDLPHGDPGAFRPREQLPGRGFEPSGLREERGRMKQQPRAARHAPGNG